LKRIGKILARYTAWILGLMKVLGIWGVFVIAFADSALLGMPVDLIVATYVLQDRSRMLLCASAFPKNASRKFINPSSAMNFGR
jgi:membrane protein YqaA with SNARE-associated domain